MSSTTRISTRIRRASALLLCALLLLSPALATEMDDDLQLGIISIVTQRLNPLTSVEREFMSLTDLVYEGLIQIDDDYQPQPCLAERWEASSGGGTWYFYLREGVTFHDGTPLTAHDVVATANEILRLATDEGSDNKGVYASLQYFVTGISANDDLTVVVKTNRKNYGFLYAMNFPILKASEVQADNPYGTGPYVVEDFRPSDYLWLCANSRWWQQKATVSEIMTTFHVTGRELVSSYENNRVDAVLTRSITAAQYRSGITNLNISYRTKQLETLMINNRSRELTDVNVRKAIRYAIDLDAIIDTAYYGMVTRADTPMIPGTWAYSADDAAFVYNPVKANELLDASVWNDSDGDGVRDTVINGKKANLHLRFYVYEEQDNSVRVEVANQISDMLAQVGIECKVESMPYADVKARMAAANYDLALATFNTDYTPDPGYLLISGNTGNYAFYRSTAMDELHKQLRQTMGLAEYTAKLREIQALFTEDCPFLCLYYRNGAILTRKVFTTVRDVREPEVLRGIEEIGR